MTFFTFIKILTPGALGHQGTMQDILGEVAALSNFMGKIIHKRTCAERDGVSGGGGDVGQFNFFIKLHGKIIVNIGRLEPPPLIRKQNHSSDP